MPILAFRSHLQQAPEGGIREHGGDKLDQARREREQDGQRPVHAAADACVHELRRLKSPGDVTVRSRWRNLYTTHLHEEQSARADAELDGRACSTQSAGDAQTLERAEVIG